MPTTVKQTNNKQTNKQTSQMNKKNQIMKKRKHCHRQKINQKTAI